MFMTAPMASPNDSLHKFQHSMSAKCCLAWAMFYKLGIGTLYVVWLLILGSSGSWDLAWAYDFEGFACSRFPDGHCDSARCRHQHGDINCHVSHVAHASPGVAPHWVSRWRQACACAAVQVYCPAAAAVAHPVWRPADVSSITSSRRCERDRVQG